MGAFMWRMNGAANSTHFAWIVEAIPAKLNSSESRIFFKLRVIRPNGRNGVKNALLEAARALYGRPGRPCTMMAQALR